MRDQAGAHSLHSGFCAICDCVCGTGDVLGKAGEGVSCTAGSPCAEWGRKFGPQEPQHQLILNTSFALNTPRLYLFLSWALPVLTLAALPWAGTWRGHESELGTHHLCTWLDNIDSWMQPWTQCWSVKATLMAYGNSLALASECNVFSRLYIMKRLTNSFVLKGWIQ